MPIKDKSLYPKDWKTISVRIRTRAEWQCECLGECGLHRTTPGPRRCTEIDGKAAKWAKGKVILTVAHLNHSPSDCRDENLKAMCQRCHLRYDLPLHMKNAKITRELKRGPLFPVFDGVTLADSPTVKQ
jgi:cytosine/adenosine deaminase-related metal-dependent hydrolase